MNLEPDLLSMTSEDERAQVLVHPADLVAAGDEDYEDAPQTFMNVSHNRPIPYMGEAPPNPEMAKAPSPSVQGPFSLESDWTSRFGQPA